MGLWPWWWTHVFSKRFWTSVKNDGWLLTYTRGHKAVMTSHTTGGLSELTRYVGRDEYGNKYYEDMTAPYYTQRRWVEYNDYMSFRTTMGNKIPPKWHGWMAGQYDEAPQPDSDNFHDPFFERPHEWFTSYNMFKLYVPRQSIINPENLQFAQQRRDRYAAEWLPTSKRTPAEV